MVCPAGLSQFPPTPARVPKMRVTVPPAGRLGTVMSGKPRWTADLQDHVAGATTFAGPVRLALPLGQLDAPADGHSRADCGTSRTPEAKGAVPEIGWAPALSSR